MATGYGICVHTVYGHHAISSTGPRGQPGVNPYRDCTGDCTENRAMSVQ